MTLDIKIDAPTYVTPDAERFFTKILPFVFLFILMSYGFEAFNSTISGDDWAAINTREYQYEWTVAIGRWASRFIWFLFNDLQFAPSFSIIFCAVAYSFYSYLISNQIKFQKNSDAVLFIAIIVIFPINIEIFSFQMLNIPVAIAFCLLSIHHHFLGKISNKVLNQNKIPLLYFILSCISLSIVAGIYQGLAIFSLFSIFLIGYRMPAQLIIRLSVIYVVLIIGSVVLYALLTSMFLLYLEVMPTESVHYKLEFALNLDNIAQSFRHAVEFISISQHLMPGFTKYVLWLSVAIYFLFAFFQGKILRSGPKIYLLYLFALVAITTCFALPALRENFNARYNIIFPLGVPYAVVLIAPLLFVQERIAMYYRLVVLIVAIIFSFEGAAASTATYWSNIRDILTVNAILDRVLNLEGLSKDESQKIPIVIIGDQLENGRQSKAHNASSVSSSLMKNSIVNCGVLDGCQLFRFESVARLTRFTDIYEFFYVYRSARVPNNWSNDTLSEVRINAASRLPFPAKSSVFVQDGAAVVLLRFAGSGYEGRVPWSGVARR